MRSRLPSASALMGLLKAKSKKTTQKQTTQTTARVVRVITLPKVLVDHAFLQLLQYRAPTMALMQ